jgi:hypothetical protein
MGATLARRPGEGVDPVPESEGHELVVGRVEVDLVIAPADRVVGPQLGAVAVGLPGQLERLGAADHGTEGLATLPGPGRGPLHQLDGQRVLGEGVEARAGLDLVLDDMGGHGPPSRSKDRSSHSDLDSGFYN